jgi:hypothetical protein
MSDAIAKLDWETSALTKYQLMISKIPVFHRSIAKIVVDKKAESNARDRGSNMIEEPDIVSAFLSEVPKAFYSLMIRLFDEVGFEYKESK